MANVANAKELFDVKVPEALSKNPDRAREVNAVYLFKINGEGGGVWTVDLVNAPPTCTPGEKGAAQCTIEVAHEDFMNLLDNKGLGMQLYMQGKLKVAGDPMLAMKIEKIFTLS